MHGHKAKKFYLRFRIDSEVHVIHTAPRYGVPINLSVLYDVKSSSTKINNFKAIGWESLKQFSNSFMEFESTNFQCKHSKELNWTNIIY